jgi:hypothetical protein
MSIEQQVYNIISHDLGRNQLMFSVNTKLVPVNERNIVCALRLSEVLHFGNRINFIIELAKFIEQSWTDIEVSDIQKKNIYKKLIDMYRDSCRVQ